MNTNLKRFSFSAIITCLMLGIYSSSANANIWYDSKGRALIVKDGKVKLLSIEDRKKPLPKSEEVPSVIPERVELREDLSTKGLDASNRIRRNRFFNSNGFGFGYTYPRFYSRRFFNSSRTGRFSLSSFSRSGNSYRNKSKKIYNYNRKFSLRKNRFIR